MKTLLLTMICALSLATNAKTWYIEKPIPVTIYQESKAVIYPNPATEKVYIKGAGAYRVEMLNMLGDVVLKEEISNSTVMIGELKAGMYIVRVYDADGALTLSSKLTKQ